MLSFSVLIFLSSLLMEIENIFIRSIAAEQVPEAILFFSNRDATSGNSICTWSCHLFKLMFVYGHLPHFIWFSGGAKKLNVDILENTTLLSFKPWRVVLISEIPFGIQYCLWPTPSAQTLVVSEASTQLFLPSWLLFHELDNKWEDSSGSSVSLFNIQLGTEE